MPVQEVLSRSMRDRRAVARYAGLTGSPDESGRKRREKGLTRSGNMIQLAWRFLMFQKDRTLAQWFRARTENARGARKTMIVALARKLLIALWRFVREGVVPDGVFARFFRVLNFRLFQLYLRKANLPARRSQLTRNSSPDRMAAPRCRSTGERASCTCRIENGNICAGASDAYTPFLQVTQGDIHHCRHQRIVEGIVLGEGWDAEILQHSREREIDGRIRRRITILAFVVGFGNLDPPVRQFDLDVGEDVFVEHSDIEIDIVSDQRTPADEMKQTRQHLLDKRALRHISLTQAMHLDSLGSHACIGANSRLETLTGQDPVSPDLDRGNRNDVVGAHVETRRLAIDRDDLVCGTRLEHEPVRLIADRGLMEKALDRAGDHVRTCQD